MTGINTHFSITLNISGLNSIIKSHRLADWIKKQDLTIWCLQEIPHLQRYTQTESKSMENNIPSTQNPKSSRVAILISDKIDFKIKLEETKATTYW